MCGIVGLWQINSNTPIQNHLLTAMTQCLRHRGPDDEGYIFVDTNSGEFQEYGGDDTLKVLTLPHVEQSNSDGNYDLAFGFRRLAILDLSAAGHQPMSVLNGQYWIVYNGEIYNYIELRCELEAKGYQFRSKTDTEVILYAYAEWGIECQSHFNGMWSFALWDQYNRNLFCSRDRFGIKPFYYYWDGQLFAFASEIKALLQIDAVDPLPNDAIIYDFLQYRRKDHTRETFFKNIFQLQPGEYLQLSTQAADIRRNQFWSLNSPSAINIQESMDLDRATRQFEQLFEDAVQLRLQSDVSIGTCLSGGLDSSSIVCVANQLLTNGTDEISNVMGHRQKTFSSCYEDLQYDERYYIEHVLKQTNALSNYIFPSPDKFLNDYQRLIWHQDEPFSGLSIFAQWCIMERVSQEGVTVLLDGQGADELLAGYHPCFDYYWGGFLSRKEFIKYYQEISTYHHDYGKSRLYLMLRSLRPFLPASIQLAGRKLDKDGDWGLSPDFCKNYKDRNYEYTSNMADPLRGFLVHLMQYSIPMLLHYEDRNSMAHSIEARVPFLDYKLVEFMFSLPSSLKMSNATTKIILRNAMQGQLPEAVRTRKDKMGFVAPQEKWLSNELNGWVKDLVNSQSFQQRAYFNGTKIQNYILQQEKLPATIWQWLCLELWFKQMIENK